MRLNKLILFVLTAIVAAPVFARADDIITFEGYPSGTVFTNQYPGVNFNGAVVLTEGVSLNSIYPPHSGVNVVYNISGPMTIDFSNPVDYFSGYFTYSAGLTVQAYNAADTLLSTYTSLCTINYIGSSCAQNEYGLVDGSDITHVVITGGSGNNFVLDDAQFTGSIDTTSPVPEPGTLLLIGSGALGLAGAVRRRLAV